MLAEMQGVTPECFHVVTPVAIETYRVADYAAYYRMVRRTLAAELAKGHEALMAEHYPEPVEACEVCVWDRAMRGAAAAGRSPVVHRRFCASHRVELVAQGVPTLTAAAADARARDLQAGARCARDLRSPWSPGARAASAAHANSDPSSSGCRSRRRRACAGCRRRRPATCSWILKARAFARDGGREYLFGVWTSRWHIPRPGGRLNDAEEKAAFEEVIDLIMPAWRSRSRHARLSLQPLRADRVQEADGPLRHARRAARSAAAGGAVRRPLSDRPAGRPRRRRELLDQEARAVLRLHAAGWS